MKEWVALIPTRSNTLRVRFTGGTRTAFGVTPATFTTDNETVIRIIESSRFYKEKRIKKIEK